jgi:hypothetical protein
MLRDQILLRARRTKGKDPATNRSAKKKSASKKDNPLLGSDTGKRRGAGANASAPRHFARPIVGSPVLIDLLIRDAAWRHGHLLRHAAITMHPLGHLDGPMLAVVRGQGSHARQWRCILQAAPVASSSAHFVAPALRQTNGVTLRSKLKPESVKTGQRRPVSNSAAAPQWLACGARRGVRPFQKDPGAATQLRKRRRRYTKLSGDRAS